MRYLSLLLFFLLSLVNGYGQKVLQMEKYGKAKTKKYYIGEVLTFQLEGDDYWYTEAIQDILVAENSVLFTNRVVKIDQIRKIKSFKNRRWSRGLSNNLFSFAGGFLGLSLLADATTSWEVGSAVWVLPTIAVVTGLLVRWLFRSKTYKLGKKRKLRVLDLNIVPYQGP